MTICFFYSDVAIVQYGFGICKINYNVYTVIGIIIIIIYACPCMPFTQSKSLESTDSMIMYCS